MSLTFQEADVNLSNDADVDVDDIPPTSGPLDETPTTVNDLQCRHPGCTNTVVYGGRGPKPKFCPEHKKSTKTTTKRSSRSGNESLAAAAADTLANMNGFLGMGMLFMGLELTAEALEERKDTFREAAYNALLTDRALCQKILSAGGTSATLGLILAYGTLGAAVGPVAWMEFKLKRQKSDDA